MFGFGKKKPVEPVECPVIITAKDVVYSPLTPSEFFLANHDEIHKGRIEWPAFIQLQIGLMDEMAGMIEKNK
jgi:hypothetical protein